MARGRPQLTQRIKLNNKLVRLQTEIAEIQKRLAGQLEGEITETKAEEPTTEPTAEE